MLAGDLDVWVALDRAAGARAAAAGGAAAIVMDDGHQNPTVRAALSLVVVDAETRGGEWPFGDGRVFPAGPMREPLAAGLARADAVVLLLPADLAEVDAELVDAMAGKPVLVARLRPEAPPPAGPLLAFAGLAKPWKMERALRAAGADLVDFAPFADHAPFTERTLAFLAARAGRLGASLVTSEKDWARLPPGWRELVARWPVRARFEDRAGLDALLRRALARGVSPAQQPRSGESAQARSEADAEAVPDEHEGRGGFLAVEAIDGGGQSAGRETSGGASHPRPGRGETPQRQHGERDNGQGEDQDPR